MAQLFQLFLILATLSRYGATQSSEAQCQEAKILKALQKNVDLGADSFCRYLLASTSYIGTLREDPTLFYYSYVTNRKSVELVYEYKTTTTKEVITSTYFGTQGVTAQSFTMPLPSYIQQYPVPRVSTACSCLVGPGDVVPFYRPCEQATTTTTFYTTFTLTVGRPGAKTTTLTETSTRTRSRYTTAPFPTKCPEADGVDYVASDFSAWDRGCGSYINCYRLIDEVKAPSLIACIERCVAYNKRIGYKQCQFVDYDPKTNICVRNNEPCYWAHEHGGTHNIATLRFLPPEPTPVTDYCATVSGAMH